MATAGAKPKYTNVDQITGLIDAYFVKCSGEILKDDDGEIIYNKHGEPVVINRKPPTVTGLALALGFTSRQALLNYQGKKQFVDTITRAKAYCEEYAESRLFDRDGARGAEFSLRCNFKWQDRPESEEPGNINAGLIAIADLIKNPRPNRELPDEPASEAVET